jgi:glyoxylase-like metal-dependent hydrolase (beta-lactamase superfamily II)
MTIQHAAMPRPPDHAGPLPAGPDAVTITLSVRVGWPVWRECFKLVQPLLQHGTLPRLGKRWRVLHGCWLLAAGQAFAVPVNAVDCAHSTPIPWRAVVPGVWTWLPERVSESAPENHGHVLPTTVVVDAGEAMVIDPGPHYAHGQRVRASLMCHFAARPRWVVNTHAHAKNVLGNAAFADLQASGKLQIMASAGTRAAMQQRCPQCLQSLTQELGAQAMRHTRIVLPNRILAADEALAVGRLRLQVLLADNAHTESDVLLWMPAQSLLLAGGLVYDRRLPELAQGSVLGWLAALRRMAALQPRVVLGSGLSVASDAHSLPPAMVATTDYLQDLRTRVWAAINLGLHGSETQTLAWPEQAHWVDFAARHHFNVQRAWRELEGQWMLEAAPASVPDVGR